MKNSILLFCLSLSFTAIAQPPSSGKAMDIIKENIAQFSKDLVNQDYDALVNTYTPDAKIFPNNWDILSGAEAIRKYWTPPADRTAKTTYHKVSPEEIKIMGNEAYDWGYYEGTTTSADGTESHWKGKYVIIWKEVEPGSWKIYLDIWNHIKS